MSESKELSLPAHLWEALDTMAHEMGVPRDSLVAQAVFTLARLNGYVIPGKANGAAAAGPAHPASKGGAALKAASGLTGPATAMKGRRAPEPEPEPEPEEEAPEEEQGNPFEEGADAEEAPEDDEAPEEEPAEEEEEAEPLRVLLVSAANHETFKLTGESMLVGRGKHCDFVIDSNRVSREHARISRDGQDFVLEDLNSSNGTFIGPNKEKVTRRKIKDGDEFTFGTEKVKFRFAK